MKEYQIYGKNSEIIAKEYLEAKNYCLLEENWRTKFGEIDLIMNDKETIVFIEVKARRSIRYGLAVEALTTKKQRQLIKLAELYIQSNRLWDYDYRIDYVSIQDKNQQIKIEHLISAVEIF